MAEHNEKGAKSEKLAIEYLAGNGFRILNTNWRSGKMEIDLIAEENHKLVVVEVKSCLAENYESAGALLSTRKMRNLATAAEAFILRYDVNMEVRFDLVVVIYGGREGIRLEHVREAFIPGVNW